MGKMMYRVYYKGEVYRDREVVSKDSKWTLLAAFTIKQDALRYAANNACICVETKVMLGNRNIWKSNTNS